MSKNKKNKNTLFSKLHPLFIFTFFFGILLLYLHNLTRDIYSGDIGDFVTASFVFGVPHPPGYPLFTFLGFIFSHIPLFLPIVTRVGIISILSSTASLIIFYKFCRYVTRSTFISMLSTSILAFSYEFWFFSEIPEVFALHGLFVTSIIYFLIRFYEEKKIHFFYLSALLLSLSITNHQTIILLFPFFLFFSIVRIKQILSIKKLLLTICFFILGFLPYVYTLIAASRNPVVNWDNASNFKNLIHLFLRLDYSTLGGSILSLKEKLPIFSVYFSSLIDNYSFLTIIIIILGVVYLFRKNIIIAISFFTCFLLSGPLFIFYIGPFLKISDEVGIIERFFLMSFIILFFFFPYGVIMLRNILDSFFSKKIYALVILGFIFIIPFTMVFYNFPKTDLSHTRIGNNLAIDILSSVSPNSSLFLNNDSVTFNTWYVHYALGARKDVKLINRPGSAGDTSLENVINNYIKKNPGQDLNHITQGIIKYYKNKGELFSTYALNFYSSNLTQIPYGLTFQFITSDQIPSETDYKALLQKEWARLHIPRRETLSPSEQNLITPDITHYYSDAYRHMGTFALRQYGDSNFAISLYKKAVWIDNENSLAFADLADIQYKNSLCSEAKTNIKSAIELYSIYRPYYYELYTIYKGCGAKEVLVDALRKSYINRFRIDPEKETINFDRLLSY